MRLTSSKRELIKKAFVETFQDGKIYLFGSRVDDTKKKGGVGDVDMGFVDQMIFRFSKLQDTMGDRLFPSLLELMGEEVRSKPFIDKLNRIEESLAYCTKMSGLHLRKDRGEIAHEYSFNQDEIIASVNVIFDSLEKLIFIFDTFYNYCKERFEFVKNSEVLA